MATYRNTATGEEAPAHRIGTNDEGQVIFQYVEGWEPTFDHDTDEDGNWVATEAQLRNAELYRESIADQPTPTNY
jgi:hypothetical protein